ncbi:MAG: phosphoserine phosphatase SerB [Hyphomonas sp.]|nr:phosphoserine phosphatase SerB [Hyphomonas sp.]HRX74250.1 phosphoserine phosphatase SerB [Hyphomonas sp.]
MSLRIVAVAAMDAGKLEALVSAELGRVAPSRTLGSVDGLVALEWAVPGGPDEAARLRGRLAGLAAPVDAAVLSQDEGRKRLLISDMDSTIIGQECLDELADFAGLKAEVSAITERAMRGELDFEGALTTRVAMLKGLGLDKLHATYKERITLNPGAKTLVATMKAHGAETVLVSGGFTYFTSRVAEAAGFASHRGNTLIDDGTALTGEVGRPILGREAKLAALDEYAAAAGISRADVVAMGDGANDLAMIKASGLGIAYHAKPVVAAEAHAAIEHTDLRAALFFQGYEATEFVG